MGRLEYMRNDKFSRFYTKIKETADKEGRNAQLMFVDFLYCAVRYGAGISDYVNYKMYAAKDRSTFVTVTDADKFYELVSPSAYKTYFTIKPNFLHNFSKWIDRDYWTNDESYEKLCAFLENNEEFMIKPIDGLGGHNVEKGYAKDHLEDPQAFYELLVKENMFVESYVKQHHIMNEIASNSVNTIRVMTYGNNGNSFIIRAYLRCGNGINHVDNFHQGGMGCLVDSETGKLVGNAFNKDGQEFEEHPYSKVKFDGFQLPNWDYVVDMVKEAALVNPNIHVVGWDVAITEEGATFIEGNRRPGWDLVQATEPSQNGSKYLMKQILDQYYKDEAEKKSKA